MQQKTIILAGKVAAGLGMVAMIVYGHAKGPDQRHTGAPGPNKGPELTCATSGCHLGTPLNGGGGNVVLGTSSGTTYTPGQKQTITITINDPVAKVYGFQMTARVDSPDPVLGQAGDFTAGTQQIVLCDDGSLKPNGKLCPTVNQTVQFIEHSSPFKTNTINVTWTAPATNVGTVTLYVAANAANGNTNELGDHIYTTQLTLCPVLTGGPGNPVISANGVQSAGGFNPKAGVASGTWLEIFGSNFAAASCVWQGADFNGSSAPTSLGGVKVTVDGKDAFVDYVSSGQVNVQVPDGIGLGAGVPLILSNPAGQTTAYPLQTAAIAPALLAPAQAPFSVNGKQYVVAQLPDASFVGMPGRAAKTGDSLTIYGIGFGPVTPQTGAGTIAPPSSSLATPLTFVFNQTPATLSYGGLAPGFVGLYQFNLKVPPLSPGDYQIKLTGAPLNQTVFLTVGP